MSLKNRKILMEIKDPLFKLLYIEQKAISGLGKETFTKSLINTKMKFKFISKSSGVKI